MPTARPRTRTRRAAAMPAARRFHLAALVTEDPLLLVGRSGTGKTFLLNTLSEALDLEHRHYNASLIAFDDLVGFPCPDEAHSTVRFLETPATVWGAESVLIDELSRCKPEHQNRLFSLVHERRLQGLLLKCLRFRWAAMNPCTGDQGGTDGMRTAGFSMSRSQSCASEVQATCAIAGSDEPFRRQGRRDGHRSRQGHARPSR